MGNRRKLQFLDGAMGTQLQAKGLTAGMLPEVFMMENPECIVEVHKAYIESGSQIIYTNTFGANRKKLKKTDYSVQDIIETAVKLARKAKGNKEDVRVALDLGPIGEMLVPNGYLPFEEAYDIFKEQILAGVKAGADLIVVETMSDLYEVKAALLAVKENCNLPVFVSMSFEEDQRTFTGCTPESFACLAERLGADAIGVNCSLGPDQLYPIVKKMADTTNLPLFIKANAGLPDPLTNTYAMDEDAFAKEVGKLLVFPVCYVGGCCGTTPEFIHRMKEVLPEVIEISDKKENASYVCTPIHCLKISDVHVIGERINPTGNKRMKQALLQGNMDEIIAIALEEVEAGADILDINVGLPGIDEKEMMVKVIEELQAVIDIPLQIDSTKPEVIEAALRSVNGIAIVNSVNGETAVMEKILPIVKKYGANVIGLTLDEQGIPHSAEQRFAIAKHIVNTAEKYGISKNQVFIDCLALTVSAQQSDALKTLQAISMVKEQLQTQTVLGVSNISFGLPQRGIINQTFLVLAMQAGLTLPIINPNHQGMMDMIHSYKVLHNIDKNAESFISYYSIQKNEKPSADIQNKEYTIEEAIGKGLKEECRKLCRQLLEEKEPLQIVNEHLIPALDIVGDRYEKKEIYLPQLINAATASKAAFDEIRQAMEKSGNQTISKGKILLATVKGDVHDIGKNIVKVVLENYGYQIIDLGKDVPVESIVETVIKENVPLVGLSALMTTTLSSMEETVKALHDHGSTCKIMVGGAVVSKEYAKQIHADYYAKDAKESADIAREVFGDSK